MDKGKLYVELVKKGMMKQAIAVLRGVKNKFSKEEVAVALGNKKPVIKPVAEKKLVIEEPIKEQTKSVEKSSDTGIPAKKKKKSKSKK